MKHELKEHLISAAFDLHEVGFLAKYFQMFTFANVYMEYLNLKCCVSFFQPLVLKTRSQFSKPFNF